MKAYTDLEQSKKLVEILPIESADCFWDYDEMQKFHRISWFEDGYNKESQLMLNENNVCAWSLAALFGVLPTTIGNLFEKNALRLRMDKGENDFNIWYENFDCGDVAEGFDVREGNPIDACFEMILNLNKQKLL